MGVPTKEMPQQGSPFPPFAPDGALQLVVSLVAAHVIFVVGSEGPFSTPTTQISCAGGGQTTTCNDSIINPTGACCSVSLLGNTTCGGMPACTTGNCP